MKIKTTELTGPALDWVVAQVIHADLQRTYGEPVFNPKTKRIYQTQGLQQIGVNYSPSTNWAQGGPIIESNEIDLKSVEEGVWQASNIFDDMEWYHFLGYSPLEAAMRCHVAHKLGEEVEIPEELLK